MSDDTITLTNDSLKNNFLCVTDTSRLTKTVKCPVHGNGQEMFIVHFSGLPSVTRCLTCVRDAYIRATPEVEPE